MRAGEGREGVRKTGDRENISKIKTKGQRGCTHAIQKERERERERRLKPNKHHSVSR